jgi:hypothetical protein
LENLIPILYLKGSVDFGEPDALAPRCWATKCAGLAASVSGPILEPPAAPPVSA